MGLLIKKININQNINMKIGDRLIVKKEKYEIKLVVLIALGVLLLSGCEKEGSYGKLDKTPYATKECINELSEVQS